MRAPRGMTKRRPAKEDYPTREETLTKKRKSLYNRRDNKHVSGTKSGNFYDVLGLCEKHNACMHACKRLPHERVLRKTFEIIDRTMPTPPVVRRVDRRGGLEKLKQIVHFLRENGYKDEDLIPYEDVEYAIIQVTQGLDRRTIRKYLNQLVRFHYLEPKGHPITNVSRVTVRTFSRVDSSARMNPKEYRSKKGHSNYIFGLQAPKAYLETDLPRFSPQESTPVESKLTSEKCVCDSRGETEENREVWIEEKKEEESTVAHTYWLSESILASEELRILRTSCSG